MAKKNSRDESSYAEEQNEAQQSPESRDDCCDHSIWSHELLGEIDGELAFGKCTVPDCNCPVGR